MDENQIGERYLQSAKKSFLMQKQLGERTLAQLSIEECLWTPHPEVNSVAVIVQHLHGNMLSRWTDFLTSDGEKDWRDRDGEFIQPDTLTKEILLQKWEEGWACVYTALDTVTSENVLDCITIRDEPHTVMEAINRLMSHYAYHIGQMVQMAKLRKGSDWQTLTIPRGQSKTWNPNR